MDLSLSYKFAKHFVADRRMESKWLTPNADLQHTWQWSVRVLN